MSKHHKYGGSTATRSLQCGAWQTLGGGMPKGKTSYAAALGTLGHSMFEKGMGDPDYEPADHLGTKVTIDGVSLEINDVIVEKVYTALEIMDDIVADWPTFGGYEISMEYDKLIGGTADVILHNQDLNMFAVGDLKTGDGKMVYAENNDQLLFYTWLAVLEFKATFDFDDETEIILFIIQPSDRRDDPYDEWVINLKKVWEFGEAFKLAVRVSESEQADPNAGEWCKYCPAETNCPAKTGMVATASRLAYDSGQVDDLLKAMGMVDDVEDWCRAVRKLAHEQAEQGVKLDGFKLVAKRATRQWNDIAAVETKCKNSNKLKVPDYTSQDLKSPAQLEKVCKSKKIDFKKFDEYISLLSSGTTLVKSSDKRNEILPLQALAALSDNIKT